MKKYIIFLTLLPSLCFSNNAEEIVNALELEGEWPAFIEEVKAQDIGRLSNYKEDPEIPKEWWGLYSELLEKMGNLLHHHYNWKSVNSALLAAINNTFTESELQEVVEGINGSPTENHSILVSELSKAINVELKKISTVYTQESDLLLEEYVQKMQETPFSITNQPSAH
ncbi:hypothetical protein [Aurantivibrio infirmus]